MKKNYTTPEQSQRLLELGIPADSADCVYDCALIGGEKYYSLSILDDELFSTYKRIWEDPCTDIIPCWSAGQLIEIFELCTGRQLIRRMDRPLVEDVKCRIAFYIHHHKFDFSELEE